MIYESFQSKRKTKNSRQVFSILFDDEKDRAFEEILVVVLKYWTLGEKQKEEEEKKRSFICSHRTVQDSGMKESDVKQRAKRMIRTIVNSKFESCGTIQELQDSLLPPKKEKT